MILALTGVRWSEVFATESPPILEIPTTPIPLTDSEPEEPVETNVSKPIILTNITGPGLVQIKRNGSDTWINATKGMRLYPGDKISTGFMSNVVLRIDDSTIIKIKSLTQITVGSVIFRYLSGKLTALDAKIELRMGIIKMYIKDNKPVKTDMKVTTPNPTCSVRGTTFGVSYNDNITSVEVFDGAVLVNTTSSYAWVIGWGNGTGQLAMIEDGSSLIQISTVYNMDTSIRGEWDLEQYIPPIFRMFGAFCGDLRRPTRY